MLVIDNKAFTVYHSQSYICISCNSECLLCGVYSFVFGLFLFLGGGYHAVWPVAGIHTTIKLCGMQIP
jgi:hypothetical protein